jgi:uncharacterized protein YndB with AHSA1/START domain
MTTLPEIDPAEIRIVRELAAPPELVWRALTDPTLLARWWGPTGFHTETHSHELRVGGSWRLTMVGPDGHRYANHAVFEVIEPQARLVLRYVDEPGVEPAQHVTTLQLEPLDGGRTRFSLILRFATPELRALVAERYGAVAGGEQTLSRLAALLEGAEGEGPPAVRLQRVLRAPPELVWAAWTEASLLKRWFQPGVWAIFECSMDLRVGGSFFYGFRGADFPETWALWTFTAVEAPRRLAFLQSFADAQRQVVPPFFGGPWPPALATEVRIAPHAGLAGGTLLQLSVTPQGASAEELAAFVDLLEGMHGGWGATLDSLEAFLSAPNGA